MKRLPKTTRKKYKMPHLYLNDVEKIERIILETKPKEYKLITKELEFDNLSEIQENLSSANLLEIQTINPSLSVYLRDYDAEVYIYNDDLVSMGIFIKIDEILKKCERKFLWVLSKIFLYSAVPIVLILVALSILLIRKQYNLTIPITIIVSSIFLIILAFYFDRLSLHRFSYIDFIKKENKPNFFKRNKDQILVALISAIVGAIIGGLIVYGISFLIK